MVVIVMMLLAWGGVTLAAHLTAGSGHQAEVLLPATP